MGNVKYPLSGDITQSINPWTWVFNTTGQQIGLFNLSVDLGHSTNPEIEKSVVSAVGYGKQLGRIEDVLDLLIKHLPENVDLSSFEENALEDYRSMRREIAEAIKHVRR